MAAEYDCDSVERQIFFDDEKAAGRSRDVCRLSYCVKQRTFVYSNDITGLQVYNSTRLGTRTFGKLADEFIEFTLSYEAETHALLALRVWEVGLDGNVANLRLCQMTDGEEDVLKSFLRHLLTKMQCRLGIQKVLVRRARKTSRLAKRKMKGKPRRSVLEGGNKFGPCCGLQPQQVRLNSHGRALGPHCFCEAALVHVLQAFLLR